MAQSTSSEKNTLKEVLVKIGDEANRDHFEQPNYEHPLESSLSTRDAEVQVSRECSSNATLGKNARIFISRAETRLEDPNWMHNRKVNSSKKYESWFLDDDFDKDSHQKKSKSGSLRVAQRVGLLFLLVAFACTLSVSELKATKLWDLPLWNWEVLALVVICGHLVSGWGTMVIVFFIESKFLLKIRVLYFVYGIRKSVQNCLWLSLVLIAWYFVVVEKIAKDNKSRFPHIMTKIMICLLVGTLMWVVKTVIVKVLASSFHVDAFFERIKVSLFKQYMIKKLKEPPMQREQEEEMVSAEMKNKRLKESTTIECLKKLHKKDVSALKMKRLIKLVQRGDIPSLYTLDEDLQDCSDEDESSLRTRYECEARKLAKKIFTNVAKTSNNIRVDDLKRYLDEDKALLVKELFKGCIRKGMISEEAFTIWMVDAFRERRTIVLSLDDTKTAVDDLHHMLDVIVAIIILIIWLIIFGIRISHFLVFISSQLLLAVFVFGNTCKTIFEAIVFIFVMHPYDVGDRCEVDGVQMIVDEMNILSTVFLRFDHQKITYPNSVLATKPIGNYFRSPGMGDEVEFSVHISTPWDKIDQMRNRIIGYINGRNDHWHQDPLVIVKDVENMNRLVMVVWPRHITNHNEMGMRWKIRSLLVEHMIKVFRELDIEYRMLPLDVNVYNITGLVSDRLPSNWKTCSG